MMLQIRFPANFVSGLYHLRADPETATTRPNPSAKQLDAIEQELKTAQDHFNKGRIQQAIASYKKARLLIYQPLGPRRPADLYLSDHSVMLPVGMGIEALVGEAGLQLADAMLPDIQPPAAPVQVPGVQLPDNLAPYDRIGFSPDTSLPAAARDAAALGLDLLAQERVQQAIEVLTDALKRLDSSGTAATREVAGAIALDLSAAYILSGEPEKATNMAALAEAHFADTKDDLGRAQAMHNRAVVLRSSGRAEQARPIFDQAARLYKGVVDKWNGATGNGLAGDGSALGPMSEVFRGPVTEAARGPVTETARGPVTEAAHGPVPGITHAPVAGMAEAPATGPAALVTSPVAQMQTETMAVLTAIRPSVSLQALSFIQKRDAATVAVRWPGAGAGWSGISVLNPAQRQQQKQGWVLGVEAGGQVISLEWAAGMRPTVQRLLDTVYKPRLSAKSIAGLAWRLKHPGETAAYLLHLYAFVIPQALGDCYHSLGDFARAESYYLEAAQYSYINPVLEVPALWARLARNTVVWGDRLYKQERIQECMPIYSRLIRQDGTAPADSPLYSLPVFAGPAADAQNLIAHLANPSAAAVNPAIAGPILTVWARWQYLNAGLDFFGTSFSPIFTFEYLQQVARGFAQQAIAAEREYVSFQAQSEAEAATRRELEGAATLAQAEVAGREEQYLASGQETAAMNSSVDLANQRVAQATAERDGYAAAGYWQYISQSIATAHGAHEDWYEDEIRKLAADMEAGSWHGDYGKLAAAATLLGGQKSYEYQMQRLDDSISDMQGMVPIAQAQAQAAAYREEAARLAWEAAKTRADLAADALVAFENEVFTPELWSRMAQVMREISQSYQEWAIRSAKLAERAYNFETDSTLKVIKNEYLAGATGGLLGADYLLRDIDSFTYYHVAHQRSKETQIKDVVSLSNEFPFQFYQFQQTGRLVFETALYDFDHRHPGFYGQRLQAVEVEVVGLLPPDGLHGALRGGIVSRYRTADGSSKIRVHGVDTMALSEYTPRGDAFLFRQDPRLHGLFEGHGVSTSWELLLPRRSNNLDYRLITDVRLVLYYTARFDPLLRTSVLTRPPLAGELVHARNLLLRYDFPEAWYGFLDSRRLHFTLTPNYLPRNETAFVSQQLAVRLITADGVSPAGVEVTVTLPGKAPATLTTDASGEIAVQPGNALAAVMGGALLGEWELQVQPAVGSLLLTEGGSLAADKVEQIALIVQYGFTWPD